MKEAFCSESDGSELFKKEGRQNKRKKGSFRFLSRGWKNKEIK